MYRVPPWVRALSLALATGLAMPAVAAEGWQPFASEAGGGRDWRTTGPMRLGHKAERPTAVREATAAQAGGSQDQCRKWRAMAAHLGETYAGHTLRHSVIKRTCGEFTTTSDESWDWPWAGLAQNRLLPPRLHRALGAWEIRCGTAGSRRRCALINVAPLPPDDAVDPGDPMVVTHFVIDMVGGRESMLWRMFVPNEAAGETYELAPTAAGNAVKVGQDAPRQRVAALPARSDTRVIRYSVGISEYTERFAACGPSGCIMEAHLGHAGEVATRLWDGSPVSLEVMLSSGRTVTVALPAKGFRAGLGELVRLRREETRSTRR